METKSITKILDFLKENPHLDLEISDIAFNLKRSEKSVEIALKKLQEKGLVTNRKSENGHIYWYALPTAPITKTIKIENVSPSTSKVSSILSTESKEEIEKETIPDLVSEMNKIKKKGEKNKISTAEEELQKNKNYSREEKENLSPAPVEEIKRNRISFFKKYELSKIPISYLGIGIFVAVLIVFFLNVIILIKFAGISKNINTIISILSKEIVTSSDLNNVVKEFTEKLGGVEEKILTLNTQVDSLKHQIQKKELELAKSKNKNLAKKRK